MPTQPINFIRGDAVDSDTDYKDALPVNMMAIMRDTFGYAGYMLQYPGLKDCRRASGVDRGGIFDSRRKRHYRVSGQKLIEVNGGVTDLGAITGTDQAQFAYSFNNLAVVAGGKMWLYSPSGGFRQITDPDLGNPIDICWVDQYFFMTDGENLFHTQIDDESKIRPTDFATSEFSPDPTYGVEKTVDNRVMVFNRYSCEFFQNTAKEDFAFSRLNGYTLEIGIVGTDAKAPMQDGFICVGNRKEEAVSVWLLSGTRAKNLATRQIEKVIGQYNDNELRNVKVETLEREGYQYAIIHLPNETILLNFTVATGAGVGNAWSTLKSDVQGETQYRAHNGVFDANHGRWIYGDKFSNRLGELDDTTGTHYGQLTEWELYTPFYPVESASIDEVEIKNIPGFNQADDATIAVSFTYDGYQYGKEKFLKYGKPLHYGDRFIGRRFGYVREYFGMKLRGANTSRIALGAGVFKYG